MSTFSLIFFRSPGCCSGVLWMKGPSWMSGGWWDPVERKRLPSTWFKMLWQSGSGPLSGVLFTHHKPVYYIDIQTTQSTTVRCTWRRPRSLFALNTSMLIVWFSYDIPMLRTVCKIFSSEIVRKHSLPAEKWDKRSRKQCDGVEPSEVEVGFTIQLGIMLSLISLTYNKSARLHLKCLV